MTSAGTSKQLKGKWQFLHSLMQTQTYDTSVMLAFKYLISAFFLACKSPKNLFLARLGFAIFYY